MKYLKFGMIAIAVQYINAGCGCCAEKKQSEEDKALDEICKYFGVSKDHVTLTYTWKRSEKMPESIDKQRVEATKKANVLMKKNKKLKSYTFGKHFIKEDKEIVICLVSDTFNINANEIVNVEQAEYQKAIDNKEDVMIYYVTGYGPSGLYLHYYKKK